MPSAAASSLAIAGAPAAAANPPHPLLSAPLVPTLLRFALPTTVSPRYAPPEDQQGVGRTPADTLNPDKALNVPYGLTLTVDLDMHAPLRAVASPSHPISVETDGGRGQVTLGGGATALKGNFTRSTDRDLPQSALQVSWLLHDCALQNPCR